MVIIGVAVVAMLGALTTSISASVEHRSLANDDTLAKSFLDTVKYQLQLKPSPGFVSGCGATLPTTILATYGAQVPAWSNSNEPPGYSIPAGYSVQITGVQCWTVVSGNGVVTPAAGSPDSHCFVTRTSADTSACATNANQDKSGIQVITVTTTDPGGYKIDLSTLIIDPAYGSTYVSLYN